MLFIFLVSILLLEYSTLYNFDYSSNYFLIFNIIIFIGFLFYFFKYKVYNTKSFLLHLSFIFIFIGGFWSKFFSIDGVMHLRINQNSNIFVKKDKIYKLPFRVKLNKFKISYYPQTLSASSYDSFVEINKKTYHIFMNNPINIDGYKIYQLSYDKDKKGSVFLIKKDYGFLIVYFGYFLFFIGVLVQMKNKFLLFLLGIFIINPNLYALSLKDYKTKSKIISNTFSKIIVQFNGRVVPMDTLDLNVLNKVYKSRKYKGMNYNQVIVGFLAYPEIFKKQKIIYIKNKKVRKILNTKYASYNDFFNDFGMFKYGKYVNEAFSKPDSKRDDFDREWLKINEDLTILYMVMNGEIFKIFYINGKWVSINYVLRHNLDSKYVEVFKNLIDSLINFDNNKLKKSIDNLNHINNYKVNDFKIKLEIFYNHLNLFYYLAFVFLVLGILYLIVSLMNQNINYYFYDFFVFVMFINMLVRWYISGHPPWSNAYESIVFIGFSAGMIGIFFRDSFVVSASSFSVAIFLFIAHLADINPQIENLVPVLKSYWLIFHVAITIISYGFLLLAAFLAIFSIFKYKEANFKRVYNLVYFGLIFLILGTILGSIWANESWGKYWSWDVKETWSLISILAYATIIHFKMPKKWFLFMSFWSFNFILMTYFGVNFYIKNSLHSYGLGDGSRLWFEILKFNLLVWVGILIYLRLKYRRKDEYIFI